MKVIVELSVELKAASSDAMKQKLEGLLKAVVSRGNLKSCMVLDEKEASNEHYSKALD